MEILKISSNNRKEVLIKISRLVRKGGAVVFPTDTVYGLLADVGDKKAVKKIFDIKKRKSEKFLPIFVKNLKTAEKLAVISANQKKILKKYWPGKLTAVLKRKKGAKIFGIDKETIALRVPNYKLINELLSVTDTPLCGTSANISGKPDSGDIQEIIKQFKGAKYTPDLILDAGKLKKSAPSTIADLSSDEIKILRQGAVKI